MLHSWGAQVPYLADRKKKAPVGVTQHQVSCGEEFLPK